MSPTISTSAPRSEGGPAGAASGLAHIGCSGWHYKSWKGDRKSTRLNSSHANISYAVFCLKKKKILFPFLFPSNLIFLHLFTHPPLHINTRSYTHNSN